ncbi:MAG TPA: hypothetical protein VG476_05840, partial [Acidimicrobiales bacterium]|nr:hypothetical protein [Acidimicrobiales bacterium]
MTDRSLKPLRNATLVAVGLVGAATLLFASYSSGFGSPTPRGIPVAVVAPAGLTRQLASSPALDVHRADSPAQVRHLIEDRTVYGGLIIEGGKGVQLDVANGAGHS